jgi:hypothetical protein
MADTPLSLSPAEASAKSIEQTYYHYGAQKAIAKLQQVELTRSALVADQSDQEEMRQIYNAPQAAPPPSRLKEILIQLGIAVAS